MIDPNNVLSGIPSTLRDELVACYRTIATNFIERRWEPSELNAGKFCEIVHSIIHGALSGNFPARASKPANMLAACQALQQMPADASRVGDRSLRIQIPRLLPFIYEVRNNRGVGHVGGDVDPNFLDASAVYEMASWTLAELIRVFHDVGTNDAQAAVDALVERRLPLIWEVNGIRRILDPAMKPRDQTLLLLYGQPKGVSAKELAGSVEYSSASMYRTRVLRPLHSDRLIEFDTGTDLAHISPRGAADVENRILKP